MTGAIYLIGGGEFARGETEAVDRRVLEDAGGEPVAAFVGAASGSRAQAVAFAGYFRSLGARTLDVALYRREDAAEPDVLDRIQRADVVYLGSGNAGKLLDALEGTPALSALLAAREAGAARVAIAEAAFALGAFVRPDDEWPSGRPGLDLLDGWIVMPRFDEAARRRELRSLLEAQPGRRGLGVRPKSAALVRDGMLEALGASIEVYADAGAPRLVRSGEAVPLEA